MLYAKFHIAWSILWSPSVEIAKAGPFYGQTWSSHGPSNWYFLNHNQCAQGCFMPNSTILVYPIVPFSWKWPKYGPFMAKIGPHLILQIGYSWIIINIPRDDPCQISQLWVYPIVPFSLKWQKYGPFMAKTWSSLASMVFYCQLKVVFFEMLIDPIFKFQNSWCIP